MCKGLRYPCISKRRVKDMILNNEKRLNPTTKTAGVEQEFQKIAGEDASLVLEE